MRLSRLRDIFLKVGMVPRSSLGKIICYITDDFPKLPKWIYIFYLEICRISSNKTAPKDSLNITSAL